MSLTQALSSRSGGRQHHAAKPVGDRRQRGERQYARLRRGDGQPGRGRQSPASPAPASMSPASIAISTRCCRTSCGPKPPATPMPTRARSIYQQLQQIYGTPGSSTSFDAIYNNFTSALQALSTSPGSYFAAERRDRRRASAGAKSQLDDRDHPAVAHAGRAGHRQRRADGQHRACSRSRRSTSSSRRASADSATATLEDQRDQDITQLTQLMNVTVVQNPDNQISVFTGTGQQLVAGTQASQLASTIPERCRRPRCGAPTRARTAPAPSR